MKKNIFLIVIVFSLFSCGEKNEYNLDGNSYKSLNYLFDNKNEITSAEDYIRWLDATKEIFVKKNREKELVSFLGGLSQKEDNELYKSLINYFISDIYWELDDKELSLLYLTKVDPLAYKEQFDATEIGYLVAKRAINYEKNIPFKEKMFTLLLTDYKSKIDLYDIYISFSDYYKAGYDIEKALVMMKRALAELPENPENEEDKEKKEKLTAEIKFYSLDKNWVYADLNSLVGKIKNAVREKDAILLEKYVSQTDFTIRLYQKNSRQNWTFKELQVGKRFNDGINFSGNIEYSADGNEAYLKSTKWDFSPLGTWTLYFKKIELPYDKKINGTWEWAGIYFSES